MTDVPFDCPACGPGTDIEPTTVYPDGSGFAHCSGCDNRLVCMAGSFDYSVAVEAGRDL